MRIIITGSPGVGKTSISKALGKGLKYKVVNEKAFAVENGIGKWDSKNEELVVPLGKLQKALNQALEKEKDLIVEGHLLCETKLKVDAVIVLRLHPELLQARLGERSYSAEKIQDNVFCEGIDYCKKHVLRRYPAKKVLEVDCKKTIKETTAHILRELKKSWEL
ncbi:MAG: AAA family ATPase [archaeon]|nr:AAA family ATPase [archaeon]